MYIPCAHNSAYYYWDRHRGADTKQLTHHQETLCMLKSWSFSDQCMTVDGMRHQYTIADCVALIWSALTSPRLKQNV